MIHIAYQQIAAQGLAAKTIGLLNEGGTRRKVIFKAPTGSGKTIMACQALANIIDALKTDATNRFEEVALIWIAPRKLHIQSYLKLKTIFSQNGLLHPVMFDELDQNEGIRPGETLFINWESVNKDTNRLAQDDEDRVSIFEISRITREKQGLPIIAVIDEEHMFWTKTADKTASVLDRINPAVEIRISATPKTFPFDEQERVSQKDVVDAGMIKKEIILNPDVDVDIDDGRTLTEHLLKTALNKRKQLADAYRKQGVNINPLLLVQLPNDTRESMTLEEQAIAEHVETFLKKICGISVDNGKLAVWLANRKDNLAGIERSDNLVQVLLFKEAIALGWDCPRAAVLLIFRKLSSNEFTIQTVGRILRMPEFKHYNDTKLNIGYVYTDIAKEQIKIISTDADYLKKNLISATRRDNLNNLKLTSTYATRPNETRNYLGPDFKTMLYAEIGTYWNIQPDQTNLFLPAEIQSIRHIGHTTKSTTDTDNNRLIANRRHDNKLRFDVENVNIPIPKDVHFQNEEQVIDVSEHRFKFSRTASEIDRVFINFISEFVTQFEEKNHPADKLASYLVEALGDYFGIFDTSAKKLVLYHKNKQIFTDIISQAIAKYIQYRENKLKDKGQRIFKTTEWEIPDERLYNEDNHHILPSILNHALIPFAESADAKTPEKDFVEFLEKNNEYIDWWYKNGDNGSEHFAIPYELPDGTKRLFYIDFVIQLKNGKLFLFDTKTSGSEASVAHLKHNGFIKYAAEQRLLGNTNQGGVIIENHGNWIYSQSKINNTTDHIGWVPFIPRLEIL